MDSGHREETPGVDRELTSFIHRWAEAIVTNDVSRMESFTTANWSLIGRPGVISRDSFHNAVATGRLRHDSMSHEVLGIDRYGSIAVIRTRGRNSGLFQGHPIKADEWIINIVLKEAGGWKCFLTQLTPTGTGAAEE